MTDTTATPAAPDDRSMQGIVNYVQDNSGYDFGEFPMVQTVFWMPPGHPNAASAFRDAQGFPIPLRVNGRWPGSALDTVLFLFEDPFEYRVYTLPIPDANAPVPPDAILTPRRFTLSKTAFAYSAAIMSFEAWRDLVVEDVKQAAGEEPSEDPDDEEPDDDDTPEPTGSAAGIGAPAAAQRTS